MAKERRVRRTDPRTGVVYIDVQEAELTSNGGYVWKTTETLRAESTYYTPVDERFDGGPVSTEDLLHGKRVGDPKAKANPLPFADRIEVGHVNDPIAERKHFNTNFRRNPTAQDLAAARRIYGTLPSTAQTAQQRKLMDQAVRGTQGDADRRRVLVEMTYRVRANQIKQNPKNTQNANAQTTLESQYNQALNVLDKVDQRRAQAQAQILVNKNLSIVHSQIAQGVQARIDQIRANTQNSQDAARKIIQAESQFEQATALLNGMMTNQMSKQRVLKAVGEAITRKESDLTGATQTAIMAQLQRDIARANNTPTVQAKRVPPDTRAPMSSRQAAISTKQNIFTGYALSPGTGLPAQDLDQMVKMWQAVLQGRWPNGTSSTHEDVELAKKQLDAIKVVQDAWAGKDNKGLAAALPRTKPLSKVDPVVLSERDYQWSKDAVAMTQGATTWYQASRSHDPRVADAMKRSGLGSAGVTDPVETVIKRQEAIDHYMLATKVEDLGTNSLYLFRRPENPNDKETRKKRPVDYSHSRYDAQRHALAKTFLEQTAEGQEIAKRYPSQQEAIADVLLVSKYRAQMHGFYRPMAGSDIKGQGGKKKGLEAHLKYRPEFESGDQNKPDSPREAKLGQHENGDARFDRYIDPMERPGIITNSQGESVFGTLGAEIAQASQIIYRLNGIPVDSHGRPTRPFTLDWHQVLEQVDKQHADAGEKTNYKALFQNLYTGPEQEYSVDKGFLGTGEDDESGDSDLANMQASHFGKTGALSRSSAEYQGRLKAQHYDTAIWRLHKVSATRLSRARLLDAMRVMMGTAEATGSARAKDLTEQVFGSHDLAKDELALLRGHHYSIDKSLIPDAKTLKATGLSKQEAFGPGVDEFLSANAGAYDARGGVQDESIFRTKSPKKLKSGSPILDPSFPKSMPELSRLVQSLAPKEGQAPSAEYQRALAELRYRQAETADILGDERMEAFTEANRENELRAMTSRGGPRSKGEMGFQTYRRGLASGKMEGRPDIFTLGEDLYGGGSTYDVAGDMYSAIHPAARGVVSPLELYQRLLISAGEKVNLASDVELPKYQEYIDAAFKVESLDPEAAKTLRSIATNVLDQNAKDADKNIVPAEAMVGRPFGARGAPGWRVFLPFNPLFSVFRHEIDSGTWVGAKAERASYLRSRLRGSGGMRYLRDVQQQELSAVANNPSSENYSMLAGDFVSLWRSRSSIKRNKDGSITLPDGSEHKASEAVDTKTLKSVFGQTFGGELVNWARQAGLDPKDHEKIRDSLFESGAFYRALGLGKDRQLTYGMIARSEEDQRPPKPRFGETDEGGFHRADRIVTKQSDYYYHLLGLGQKPAANVLQYPMPTFDVQRDTQGNVVEGRENEIRAAYAKHVRNVRESIGFMDRDTEDRVRNRHKYTGAMPLDKALKFLEIQHSRQVMGMALRGARQFAQTGLRSPIGVMGDDLGAQGFLVDFVPDEQNPEQMRPMTPDERFAALTMRREHQVEQHSFEEMERATPHLYNWLTGRVEKFHDAHLGAAGTHAPPERRMLELGLAASAAFEAIASQHEGKLGNQKIQMHTNMESMDAFRARIIKELTEVKKGNREAWGQITMTRAMIGGETPFQSAKAGANRTVGLAGIASLSQAQTLEKILPQTLDALYAAQAENKPISFTPELLTKWSDLMGWSYDKDAFQVATEDGYIGMDPRNPHLPSKLIGRADGNLEIIDELSKDSSDDFRAIGSSVFPHLGDYGTPDNLQQERRGGHTHLKGVHTTAVRWPGKEAIDAIHRDIFDLNNPESGLSRLLNPAPYEDPYTGRTLNLADEAMNLHGTLREVMNAQNQAGQGAFGMALERIPGSATEPARFKKREVRPGERDRIAQRFRAKREAARIKVLQAQRRQALDQIKEAFIANGAAPGAADYATGQMAKHYGRSSSDLNFIKLGLLQKKGGAQSGQATIDAMLFGLPSLFSKGKDLISNWWHGQQKTGIVSPAFRRLNGQYLSGANLRAEADDMGLGLFGPTAKEFKRPLRNKRGQYMKRTPAQSPASGGTGRGGGGTPPPPHAPWQNPSDPYEFTTDHDEVISSTDRMMEALYHFSHINKQPLFNTTDNAYTKVNTADFHQVGDLLGRPLSEAQAHAVGQENILGSAPKVVEGNPGSGKSDLDILRVLHTIRKGVTPERAPVLLSFAKRSIEVNKERLEEHMDADTLGRYSKSGGNTSFHALGLDLINILGQERVFGQRYDGIQQVEGAHQIEIFRQALKDVVTTHKAAIKEHAESAVPWIYADGEKTVYDPAGTRHRPMAALNAEMEAGAGLEDKLWKNVQMLAEHGFDPQMAIHFFDPSLNNEADSPHAQAFANRKNEMWLAAHVYAQMDTNLQKGEMREKGFDDFEHIRMYMPWEMVNKPLALLRKNMKYGMESGHGELSDEYKNLLSKYYGREMVLSEGQDASIAHLDLAKILGGGEHNLFVTGDPKQDIFPWRGASRHWFKMAGQAAKKAGSFTRLTDTYRFTGGTAKFLDQLYKSLVFTDRSGQKQRLIDEPTLNPAKGIGPNKLNAAGPVPVEVLPFGDHDQYGGQEWEHEVMVQMLRHLTGNEISTDHFAHDHTGKKRSADEVAAMKTEITQAIERSGATKGIAHEGEFLVGVRSNQDVANIVQAGKNAGVKMMARYANESVNEWKELRTHAGFLSLAQWEKMQRDPNKDFTDLTLNASGQTFLRKMQGSHPTGRYADVANIIDDVVAAHKNLMLPYNGIDPSRKDQDGNPLPINPDDYVIVGTVPALKGDQRKFAMVGGMLERLHKMRTASNPVEARQGFIDVHTLITRAAQSFLFGRVPTSDERKQFASANAPIDEILDPVFTAARQFQEEGKIDEIHVGHAPRPPKNMESGAFAGPSKVMSKAERQRRMRSFDFGDESQARADSYLSGNLRAFGKGGTADPAKYDQIIVAEDGKRELVYDEKGGATLYEHPTVLDMKKTGKLHVLPHDVTERALAGQDKGKKLHSAFLGFGNKQPAATGLPLDVPLKGFGTLTHFQDTAEGEQAAKSLHDLIVGGGRINAQLISEPGKGHVVKTNLASDTEAQLLKGIMHIGLEGEHASGTGQNKDYVLSKNSGQATGHSAYDVLTGPFSSKAANDFAAGLDQTPKIAGVASDNLHTGYGRNQRQFNVLNAPLEEGARRIDDLKKAFLGMPASAKKVEEAVETLRKKFGVSAQGILKDADKVANHHVMALAEDTKGQPAYSHERVLRGATGERLQVDPRMTREGLYVHDYLAGGMMPLKAGQSAPQGWMARGGGDGSGDGHGGGYGTGWGGWAQNLMQADRNIYRIGGAARQFDQFAQGIQQRAQAVQSAGEANVHAGIYAMGIMGGPGIVVGQGGSFNQSRTLTHGIDSLLLGSGAGLKNVNYGANLQQIDSGSTPGALLHGAWDVMKSWIPKVGGSGLRGMSRQDYFHNLGVTDTSYNEMFGAAASVTGFKLPTDQITIFSKLSDNVKDLGGKVVDMKDAYGDQSAQYKSALAAYQQAGGTDQGIGAIRSMRGGQAFADQAGLIGAWASNQGLDANQTIQSIARMARASGYSQEQINTGPAMMNTANIIQAASVGSGLNPQDFSEASRLSMNMIGPAMNMGAGGYLATQVPGDQNTADKATATIAAWIKDLASANLSPDQISRTVAGTMDMFRNPQGVQSQYVGQLTGQIDQNSDLVNAGNFRLGTFNQQGQYSGVLPTGDLNAMQNMMSLHQQQYGIANQTIGLQQTALSLGYQSAMNSQLDMYGRSTVGQPNNPGFGQQDYGYNSGGFQFHGEFAIQAKSLDIQAQQVDLSSKQMQESAPYEKAAMQANIALSSASSAENLRMAQADVNLQPQQRDVFYSQQAYQSAQLGREKESIKASRAYEDLLYGAPGTDHSYESYYNSQSNILARGQGMSNVGNYSVGAAVQAVGLQAAQTYRGIDYQETMLTLGQSSLNSGAMYAAQMKYMEDQKKFAGMQYNAQSDLTKGERGRQDVDLQQQTDLLQKTQALDAATFELGQSHAQVNLDLAKKQADATAASNAQTEIELKYYDQKLDLQLQNNKATKEGIDQQRKSAQLNQIAAEHQLEQQKDLIALQQQLQEMEKYRNNGGGEFGNSSNVPYVDKKGNLDAAAIRDMMKTGYEQYAKENYSAAVQEEQGIVAKANPNLKGNDLANAVSQAALDQMQRDYFNKVQNQTGMDSTMAKGVWASVFGSTMPADLLGKNGVMNTNNMTAASPEIGAGQGTAAAAADSLTAAATSVSATVMAFDSTTKQFTAWMDGKIAKSGSGGILGTISGGAGILANVIQTAVFGKALLGKGMPWSFGKNGGPLIGNDGPADDFMSGGGEGMALEEGGGMALPEMLTGGAATTGLGILAGGAAGGALGYGADKLMQHFGLESGGSHYGTAIGAGAGIGMMLGGPLGALIGGGLAGGGYALYKNKDAIMGGLGSAAGWTADEAKNLGGEALGKIKDVFSAIKGLNWDQIKSVAKDALLVVGGPFTAIYEIWKHSDDIKGWAQAGWDAISGAFKDVADFATSHAADLLSGITTIFTTLGDGFSKATGWLTDHAEDIYNDATGLWNQITGSLSNAWDYITQNANGVYDMGKNIIDWITGLPGQVISGAGDIGTLGATLGKGMVNAMIDMINAIFSAISGIKIDVPGGGHLGIPDSIGMPTLPQIPHLAVGGYAQGGMTLVGEQGPELVKLPKGTMVEPAGRTAQMLRDYASSTDVIAGLKRGLLDYRSQGSAPTFGLTPLGAANMGRSGRQGGNVEINITIESGASIDEKLISRLKSEVLASVREALEEN